MNRRHVLLASLGGAATLAVGVVGADILSKEQIVASVRRRLSTLQLDEAGLHAFADDQISTLLAKRPTWFRIKFHIRKLFTKEGGSFTGNLDLTGTFEDRRSRHQKLEDNLAMIFLLSSDFFWSGADESKVVRYVALYDPLRACGNPFARAPTG